MRIKSLLGALAILSFLLFACSSAEKDYEKAKQENTAQAYEKFIQKHPQSNLVENASRTLDSIRFEMVKSKRSIEAYNEFVKKYPQSNFINEAKINIDVLKTGGETILKDRTLFTVDFYKRVKASLDMIRDNKGLFRNEFSLKVPSGEEPDITNIHMKYDMPFRMEEHKPVAVVAHEPLDLIIHWYGDFGFGIPKDTNDKTISNKVMWIFYKGEN
jgi:outer membrane protein assembly factor BamD (BamD/ComL family)